MGPRGEASTEEGEGEAYRSPTRGEHTPSLSCTAPALLEKGRHALGERARLTWWRFFGEPTVGKRFPSNLRGAPGA
jgi:hypothetical protein